MTVEILEKFGAPIAFAVVLLLHVLWVNKKLFSREQEGANRAGKLYSSLSDRVVDSINELRAAVDRIAGEKDQAIMEMLRQAVAPGPRTNKPQSSSEYAKFRYIDSERIGDLVVIRIQVEKLLDEQLIQAFGDEVFRILGPPFVKEVVIDFGRVEFFSSAGAGKLISSQRILNERKGKLILAGVDPHIRELFTNTKLDKLMPIVKDVDAAMKKLSVGTPSG
jgi:anti-sigma B factor antagonist